MGHLIIYLQDSHLSMISGHHRSPFLKLLQIGLLLASVVLGSDAHKYRAVCPLYFRETMSKSASTSFVFANAKGELGHIVSQLKRVGNIESVTPVTGRFDLVIRLKTNEPIKAFNIDEKIRSITGITSTQTAPSTENVSNPRTSEE